MECKNSTLIEMTGCTFDANATTYDAVYNETSRTVLSNCGLYNCINGMEV